MNQFSCLEGVIDVEEGKLEEKLVDKPGTTIGTKLTVLHCIRIPFLMRCGFLTVDPIVRSWRRVRTCRFCTLIDIVTETAMSPLEHCPLNSHCRQSQRIN